MAAQAVSLFQQKLPDSLVVEVVNNLSLADKKISSLVCRSFNDFSGSRFATMNLQYFPADPIKAESLTSTVKRYGSDIKHLNYPMLMSNPQFIARYLAPCPNIESLKIQHSPQVTGALASEMIPGHAMLQRINLNGCSNVDDTALRAIAQCCTKLVSLQISGCDQVTGGGVSAIARACPNITEVDLTACKHLNDESLIELATYSKSLTAVSLTNCLGITDTSVIVLAQSNPKLRQINLNPNGHITDRSLIAIGANCPDLTSINLSHCPLITEAGLHAIADGCQKLKMISLTSCPLIPSNGGAIQRLVAIMQSNNQMPTHT